jgi:putative Mn2+ efflux pump MntP
MRKIVTRAWFALSVPVVGLVIMGFFTARNRGWFAAVIVCGLGLAFVLWQWLDRIRKYPNDTWRPRL